MNEVTDYLNGVTSATKRMNITEINVTSALGARMIVGRDLRSVHARTYDPEPHLGCGHRSR
jgi:hypothetical protein